MSGKLLETSPAVEITAGAGIANLLVTEEDMSRSKNIYGLFQRRRKKCIQYGLYSTGISLGWLKNNSALIQSRLEKLRNSSTLTVLATSLIAHRQ